MYKVDFEYLSMEDYQEREGGGMISRFKLVFTKATEVGFINPETMKKQWYTCYYGKGTTMEVADLLSGNTQHIFGLCTDGEIVVLDTQAVKIESV